MGQPATNTDNKENDRIGNPNFFLESCLHTLTISASIGTSALLTDLSSVRHLRNRKWAVVEA